jgi:UDP-2,3-diacylglucosamine pyrophosphatase LpxH
MISKPVTVVISDLHVGGGKNDPNDDHVYDTAQFRRFIDGLTRDTDGQAGKYELLINGDFLEFAQVAPSAYKLRSAKYWCSEAESVLKLDQILTGHADVFDALRAFAARRNIVTIAAGNHDVDLYWPEVQKRLQKVAGPLRFAVGVNHCRRYKGRLHVEHGHRMDPANWFTNWKNPILKIRGEASRLEMCAGTLFMVNFVNWLEDKFPFADNIKPITALGRILWKEKKLSFAAAAWKLSQFSMRHPKVSLGSDQNREFPERFRLLLRNNPTFRKSMAELYRRAGHPGATSESIVVTLNDEKAYSEFLTEIVTQLPPDVWCKYFETAGSSTLSQNVTLKIGQSGFANEKEVLRTEASRILKTGVHIAIFGHTHQPDEVRNDDGAYFNPGSWTRYEEIENFGKLSLEDLKDETAYPYALNYIRVEQTRKDNLHAEKLCFDSSSRRKPRHRMIAVRGSD